jgi:hypothetical protein
MGIFRGLTEQWQAEHGACLKEMNMLFGLLGSLSFSLLMALLFHKLGINTFRSGAITGTWITLLNMLWFGLWNGSTFTAYPWSWLTYDVIGNTIVGAVAGGVVGWIYGKMK